MKVWIGVLCALLCVSVVCNLCFYGSRKMCLTEQSGNVNRAVDTTSSTSISTHSEPLLPSVSHDAETAPVATKETVVEKPQMVLSEYNAECSFDDNGFGACRQINLMLRGLRSENTISVIDKVSVLPEPLKKGEVITRKGILEINGVFECGKEYLVTLPAGLRTEAGITDKEYAFLIKTDKPEYVLGFSEPGDYYPVTFNNGLIEHCPLAIEVCNIKKVSVAIEKLRNEDLDIAGVIDANYYGPSVFHEIKNQEYETQTGANRLEKLTLDIAEMLKGVKPGVYSVNLRAVFERKNEDDEDDIYDWNIRGHRHLKLYLTNLGLSVVTNNASKEAAVYVRALDTMAAVKDAKVRVYTDKRVLLGEAITGDDGIAKINYSSVDRKIVASPAFAVVEKDGDCSLINITQNAISNAEYKNEGRAFQECNAFIYTERGIYRPGETVNASICVRKASENGFVACQLPCDLKMVDSRGNVVNTIRVNTNADGFGTAQFTLGADAPSGVYLLECGVPEEKSWNSIAFNVGAFIPDRIKVKLTSESDIVRAKQPINATLEAGYFFGSELKQGFTRLLIYDMGAAIPNEWKEYSVGNGKKRGPSLIYSGDSQWYSSFSKGNISFEDIDEIINSEGLDNCVPRKLKVICEVHENGERTISDSANIIYDTQDAYLGLKYTDATSKDAVIACKMLGRNAETLKLHEPLKMRVTLRKKSWEYVVTQNGGKNKREWREIIVNEKTLPDMVEVTSEESKLVLPQLAYGNYELEASCENGVSTTIEFWHWWGDGGSVRSSNPAVLTVTADAEKYVPGQTATLSFDASEGALLVAAGERTLADVRSMTTVAGKNSVQIHIPENVIGNHYFAELSLITKNKDGDASRSYALLRVPVDQDARRLKLHLKAPELAEPGEKIDIEITAKNNNAPATAGTVQVFAVDEGILSLTAYKTPDIFDFFHGGYYCDFETSDIYARIFPKASMGAARKIGGGDGLAGLRLANQKNKANAVVVLPPVALKDGVARVTMSLPKHTGAMRIMAVAANAEIVGSSDVELRMREKASVQALMPSAVAKGDKFDAVFSVFNHEYEDGTTELAITCPDGLKADGKNTSKFTVTRGNKQNVSMTFVAEKDGDYEVKYSAKIGGKQINGVEYLKVRPAKPAVTVTELKVLNPGEEYTVAIDGWDTLYGCNAEVSQSPALAARDALNWLNEYPYGCLEQTVSCSFPMLAAEKLHKCGLIPESMLNSVQVKIDDAVLRVLRMQRGVRGFAMWPELDNVWDETGIYAAHFLALSKSKYISDEQKKNVISYLTLVCKEATRKQDFFTQAYAAYVLALFENDLGAKRILQNMENWKGKPSMASFLAGAALIKAGYASRCGNLVGEALEKKVWLNEDTFVWYFNDVLMKKALVLSIAMEILPDARCCDEIALELAKQIRKDGTGWGTTSANAWCTYGLAAYAGKNAALNKAGTVQGWKKMNCTSGQVIKNEGQGRIFVQVQSRGIPSGEPVPGLIPVKKEYLDQDGKPVSSVKCGDLVNVRITVDSSIAIASGVLVDLLPGGFEIENGTLATRVNMQKDENKGYVVQHCEMLSDRYLLFCKKWGDTMVFNYSIRAVHPGTYAIPTTTIEDMYKTGVAGSFNCKDKLTINN